MARDKDERSADDETTVISNGRHAAHADATYNGVPDNGVPGNGVPDNDVPENDVPDNDVPDNGRSDGGAGPHHQQRQAIDPPRSTTDAGRQQVSLPPGPALVAIGLGLLTKNGWVFQDINLTLRQSSVAAIVGPAGTGRTSLLLALVGRMEANTGSLTVAGHSLRDRPKNVRAVTSVARAGRLTAPEPGLTVSESVAERCLIEDENVLAGRSRFEEACAALRLEVDPTMLVGRLAGEQATLLAVALACVRVSAVIILDDLDRDVSAATQQRIVDALIRLAQAMGPTILVSTTDRIPVMEADVVLDLTPMDGAAIWELDPRSAPTESISRQLDRYQASGWGSELPAVDADPDPDPDPGTDPDGEPWTGPNAGDGAQPDGPDVTDLDGGSGGAPSWDYDGRWSRERWETGPHQPGDQDFGAAQESTHESAPPADSLDPNSTRSSDRSGDSDSGPTEDPR